MDGAEDVGRSIAVGKTTAPAPEYVSPSRASALAALHDALDRGTHPALLTGGPGVGKSWLTRQLCRNSAANWRWAGVDLSPAVVPSDLGRLVARSMGLPKAGRIAEVRGAVEECLAESAVDGLRWGLLVDEAHLGTPEVLDELRVLANRLGEPGSWAGMLLVGQTALLTRLGCRDLAGLDARIGRRVHLRPLGLDEWRDWLSGINARVSAGAEFLHREARGNPRRLLAYLDHRNGSPAGPMDFPSPAISIQTPATETASDHAWVGNLDPAQVAPVKPPLEIGEGMIEVGWDASPEVEPDPEPSAGKSDREYDPPASEERVDDHYAALQAWTEWSENQGRRPYLSASPTSEVGDEVGEDEDGPKAGRPGVRAEGQHGFAPYSQLFSRLNPSPDPQ